ncbi:hypothetical protein ACIG3E_10650 [Streptomyces sp. NPDC053474]|uniref:hypothetical protein n=1 Tax=Streptomyces sp. NPDC053474 TaxID=3365704 RepID=UPI0037D566FF
MIDPTDIPQFTGSFEQLEKDISALRSNAVGIRNGGASVHSRFQMLGAYYKAPEADDLFATTQPVMDRADSFAGNLEKVADALETFVSEARPFAKRLDRLRARAVAFVASVEGDDDWTEDQDKVDEHQQLMRDVAAAKNAFEEAERNAASKISAIVGGPKFVVDDGSHKANKKEVMYGYDLDTLNKAKELPWGTPESRTYEPGSVDWFVHGAKSYIWDGLIIDGAWAGLKGLGTLAGIGEGDTSEAWSKLGDVLGGIGQYTAKPYDWAMDQAFGPDEESAGEKRQKQAARDFAKAVVAWDQWDENPARAAGTATFNMLTLGAAPMGAASAAAKGGSIAAKGAGALAKVGNAIDPVVLGARATGKAIRSLPKLSEVTSRLRTGLGLTPDRGGVYSEIPLDDGSKVVIKDGKWVRVNADGKPITETPHQESPAHQRTQPENAPTPQPEPALVGSGAQSSHGGAVDGLSPRAGHGSAGGHLPPQASHDTATGGGGSAAARGPEPAPGRDGGDHHSANNSSGSPSRPSGTDAQHPGAGEPSHAPDPRGSGSGGRAGDDVPDTHGANDGAEPVRGEDAEASSAAHDADAGNHPGPTRPELLPADGPLTLDDVRKTRHPRTRWERGEEFHRQMFGGAPERHYPVPTNADPVYPVTASGGRKVDVPVDMPDGRTLAVEVKTYREYRTITLHDGTKKAVKGEVPLSKHIKEQIHKDIALRRIDPKYDPRWSFTHAGPSAELRDYLKKARIIFLEYGPTPKQ